MYRFEYINNSLFNTLALEQGHSEEAWYGYRVKYLRKNNTFISKLTFEVRNIAKRGSSRRKFIKEKMVMV